MQILIIWTHQGAVETDVTIATVDLHFVLNKIQILHHAIMEQHFLIKLRIKLSLIFKAQ